MPHFSAQYLINLSIRKKYLFYQIKRITKLSPSILTKKLKNYLNAKKSAIKSNIKLSAFMDSKSSVCRSYEYLIYTSFSQLNI